MKRKKIKLKELRLSIGKKQSMFHCEIKKTNVFWYEAISQGGTKSTRKKYWYEYLKPPFLLRFFAEIFKIMF